MGTDLSMTDNIASALFGKTRRALLALLFTHADESFYVREIFRALAIGQGTVQRELARLTDAGLIIRSQKGNQVYYQANRDSPVFEEIRTLMVKTAGISDVLRTALSGIASRIAVAFIYGSIVEMTERAASDVDIIVIGDVAFADVTKALRPAEETLRREINPMVMPVKEFREKIRAKHHFLSTVMESPKIFLWGGEHELREVGGRRLAKET